MPSGKAFSGIALLVVIVLAVACPRGADGQYLAAPAATSAREVPSEVKWGVVIGAVTGAAVAAVIVFRGCKDGYECNLRSAAGIVPISLGAIVGLTVGGSIGKAIADDSEFNVGIRLAIPR